MKVKDPAKTADEIVDTYNSRDPERIAKLCGILIKEVDWDKQSGACLYLPKARIENARME